MPDPTGQGQEARVGASPKHPHEPETTPVYDNEGRCLICALSVAHRERDGAVARAEKAEADLERFAERVAGELDARASERQRKAIRMSLIVEAERLRNEAVALREAAALIRDHTSESGEKNTGRDGGEWAGGHDYRPEDSTPPERCPTCGSKKPHLQIVQGSDVLRSEWPGKPCPDPFHGSREGTE